MSSVSATAAALLLSLQAALAPAGPAVGQESLAEVMRRQVPAGAACLLDIEEGVVIASTGREILLGGGRPAGSVLKIFTTYALLAAGGPPSFDEVHFCQASTPTVPATDTCWYRPGHGNMTLRSALAHSCNAYFRQWLHGKDLASAERFLRELRLLDGELPDDPRRRAMALTGLSPALRPRPVDLLAAAAALFNGGVLFSLSTAEEGERCAPLRAFALDDEAVTAVRDGLRECAAAGTGRAAQDAVGLEPLLVKTGTSVRWTETGPDESATDGWCIALHPAERPRVLLLVFAPRANGSDGAAPAAGAIMRRYLRGGESE